MRILREIEAIDDSRGRAVVTIGNFDGLHLGHQRLIGRLIASARECGGPAVVVTFEPHPLSVIAPERPNPLITPGEDRLRLLERLGIDVAFVVPFTREFARQTARQFVVDHLHRRLGLRHLVVGPDARFGCDRGGDIDELAALGKELGFSAEAIEPVVIDGVRVSSSEIRARVLAGDVTAAGRMLGRYFRLRGEVVHGQRRGRQMGIPTANLAPNTALAPANGVYVGRIWWRDTPHPAVINIGIKPTFGERRRTFEAHILDWNGTSLYGETLSFEFHSRLRGEQRFPSVRELIDQIHLDIAQARELLGVA